MLAITENSEGETRRRFQFCIERLQGLGRLFLQLPARSIRSLERGGARDRPGALLAGVGCAPRLPGRRESIPPAYRNGLAQNRDSFRILCVFNALQGRKFPSRS